eukprot:CAMPEP_0206283924 /NCGR_PEP_ID=MMETSP0047_2-20121206/40491_1 /ASSEMBLY_ACC=CAM_ASM_000192 /TAXON_ID=195065 /ORGANISM="Chroomonas mesostigmatica_cf, Strain CCMP1168" /LENGTH=117 /DNA_ID=CAMNT_0053714325 /DNA_START=401 /DNA_END=754 /DNA_ORIENTATION=+
MTAMANLAMLAACIGSGSASMFVTAMYASPIVSIFRTLCSFESWSISWYNLLSMSDTFEGSKSLESVVKPTMSLVLRLDLGPLHQCLHNVLWENVEKHVFCLLVPQFEKPHGPAPEI